MYTEIHKLLVRHNRGENLDKLFDDALALLLTTEGFLRVKRLDSEFAEFRAARLRGHPMSGGHALGKNDL